MPRLKQQIALSNLAVDSLVVTAVDRCDKLSVCGNGIRLSLYIARLKEHLLAHLPGPLFDEFSKRFLDRFFSIATDPESRLNNRPDSHYRAALEMILDLDFVGVTCEGFILRYLEPGQSHRLRGLTTIDGGKLRSFETISRDLITYRLQDLTTFIFPKYCTDRDLEIIGSSCSKLQILRVQESNGVSDRGLRALSPCSLLRIIDYRHCPVSVNGVNGLLDVHKRLEEFNAISEPNKYPDAGFDILSRPISSVCPSVKRFAVVSVPATNQHLRSIVTLFPNLTGIQLHCQVTGDLRILTELKCLEELDLGIDSGGFGMGDIKQLLMINGTNIFRLTLPFEITVTPNDLNFISTVCSNIESMSFYYRTIGSALRTITPSFRQLENFECSHYLISYDHGAILELEFRKMSKL